MTRALLTGGTGFVGSNLARRLLRDGQEVHLLVRPGFTVWRIDEILDRVTLHVVELSRTDAVTDVLRAIHPSWVFHLAAYGAYSSQTDLEQMLHTNVVGTVNLVNASLETGCEAFVHAGSSSEYGFKDHPPAEDEWLEPNSTYAWSKASASLFCRLMARTTGANITTLRLYSVYGPYEESTRLMPTVIARGLQGELPPLVNPDIARDFVYVDDVCDAFILAAAQRHPGAVYNIGTGIQTSLREVITLARRVLKIAEEPVWGSMPNRSWDTSVWVADNRATQAALGWRPRYSFDAGFREFVSWVERRKVGRD